MTEDLADLEGQIEWLAAAKPHEVGHDEVKAQLARFLAALESGTVRAASKQADGTWVAHAWVKQGILLCFRWGEIVDCSISPTLQFRDKDTLPTQDLAARPHPPRVVPGGTAVRGGVFLGRQIVIMPPSYVNVGAYVDDETMIDSHALVGSCAQVGKRVHLSAAVQLGGVLEPVGVLPVIVEDDVFVGAQCGVFEGTVIQSGAVLGAGVILTRGTPVFDLARERIYRADSERPLVIPERAVVVPGARPARGSFAAEHGLSLQTPVIVRYREPGEAPIELLEAARR